MGSKNEEKVVVNNNRGYGVEENLPLVYSLVHKTLFPKFKEVYSVDELIQIGTLGLITASKRFDPSKGIKFSTYASKFIIGYVYNNIHADRFIYLGRRNSNTNYQRVNMVYLDGHVTVDATNGTEICMLDTLEDEYCQDSYEHIENQDLLKDAVMILNDREKDVIHFRYNKGLTQAEVAEKIGISQSYVARIDQGAVKKLKNYMRKEGLLV